MGEAELFLEGPLQSSKSLASYRNEPAPSTSGHLDQRVTSASLRTKVSSLPNRTRKSSEQVTVDPSLVS